MTLEGDLLRIGRRAWTLFACAGLWCALLPVVCSSTARAREVAAGAQGFAEIGRDRPGAAPQVRPAAPPGHENESDPLRLARVDHELAEIDALLATAHFRTALAMAEATRDLLAAIGKPSRLGARRARLEVMAATAEVALGRNAQARQSMIRALRADATLALDESEASPKVLKALREARRRTGIAEPKP